MYSYDASGANLDRPGLHQVLADAHSGTFDILLVYRVDRFTRRIRDSAYLVNELDHAHVVFHSATESFDRHARRPDDGPDTRRVRRIRTRDHHDRVINSMERKAARGRWTVGTAPYGYTIDPADHVLQWHPGETLIVEEIFHLYTYRRLGRRRRQRHP